ncbi:hypothetical protein A4G19_12885 [Pasteurellaceae bacterium Macca]|nr:hypothetical protein [Pasteurellaceae bacterium Macca]
MNFLALNINLFSNKSIGYAFKYNYNAKPHIKNLNHPQHPQKALNIKHSLILSKSQNTTITHNKSHF